jgi:hypothetical protein
VDSVAFIIPLFQVPEINTSDGVKGIDWISFGRKDKQPFGTLFLFISDRCGIPQKKGYAKWVTGVPVISSSLLSVLLIGYSVVHLYFVTCDDPRYVLR